MKQAITWTNTYPELRRLMVSLGHNLLRWHIIGEDAYNKSKIQTLE